MKKAVKALLLSLALTLVLGAAALAEDQLVLPASTREIRSEAFKGTDIVEAVLPEGIDTIGSEAFADCAALTRINLPASLRRIAADAFRNCPDLVATVELGSRAQAFCRSAGVRYQCDPDALTILRAADYQGYELDALYVSVMAPLGSDGLLLYDETGALLASWTAAEGYRDPLAQYWNFDCGYVFPEDMGETHAQWTYVLTAGETRGAPWAITVDYEPGLNSLVSDYDIGNIWDLVAGEETTLTVYFEQETHYLRLLDGDGSVLLEASDFWADVTDGSCEFALTFDQPGEYELHLLASVDGQTWKRCSYVAYATVSEANSVATRVNYFGAPAFASDGCAFKFWGNADSSANYIGLFEGDVLLESWAYEDMDYFYHSISGPGEHELTLRASLDGENWTASGETATVRVVPEPVVTNTRYMGYAALAGDCELEVWDYTTTPNARYLALFDEDGQLLYRLEESSSSLADGEIERSWNGHLPFTIMEPGEYAYSLRASADGESYGPPQEVPYTISPRNYVSEVSQESWAGTEALLRIETALTATQLRITDWQGNALDLTVEGEPEAEVFEKEWLVRCAFPAEGEYLVFIQAADGEQWGDAYMYAVRVGDSEETEPPAEICGFNAAFGTRIAARIRFRCETLAEADLSAITAIRLCGFDGAELHSWGPADLALEENSDGVVSELLTWDLGAPGTYCFYDELAFADGSFRRNYHRIPTTNAEDLCNYDSTDAVRMVFGDLVWTQVQVYDSYLFDQPEGLPVPALTPRSAPGRFYLLAKWDPTDFALVGETDLTICGVKPGMTMDEAREALELAGAHPTEGVLNDEIWQYRGVRFDYINVSFTDGIVTSIDTYTYSGEG